jgi:hypothetical protein
MRAAGHQAVSAAGAAAAELARSFAPDRVLVPRGQRGDDARAWFGLGAAELDFETAELGEPIPEPAPPARKPRYPDLEKKLRQVRFSDYFSILEIGPGASDYEVRGQYERLSALYDPTGWPAPLGVTELAWLVEIRRGLADALDMLDPKHRSRYERALQPSPSAPRRG